MLFEDVYNSLVDFQMISQHNVNFIVNIIYFVSVFLAYMFSALYINSLTNLFAISVNCYSLFIRNFKRERFRMIVPIEFDQRCVMSSVKSWVFSPAKSIILENHVVEILSKRSESDGKVLLFLFQIHKRP